MKLHSRGNILLDNKIARKKDKTDEDLASFDLYKLLMVYEKMMFNFTHRIMEVTHTVIKYPYTIEQQKKAIAELIEINSKLDFHQIAMHSKDKVQFVYNFLAILEMLQQRLLEIQVGIGYNSFWIEKRTDLN